MVFMKKKIYLLSMLYALCSAMALPSPSHAVTIKKADVVAPAPKASNNSPLSGNSLVPTALSLITGVMALNQQMSTLTGDCIPTAADVAFVSNAMKEFAKTGAIDGPTLAGALRGRAPCDPGNSVSFDNTAQTAAVTSGLQPCYETFNQPSDKNMIWFGYPRPGLTKVCKKNGGAGGCAPKDEEVVSDVWDVFALVNFTPDDLLPQEATAFAKLMDKVERCSGAKLSAAKRALWVNFMTQEAGSLGTKTGSDLASTLGTVNQIMASGGGTNPMSALMGLAPTMMGNMMK
ncbi:MAG: hypothetical protein FWC51_04645 [Proteobacteria bacterium]|nr:hypothetical protein [Pseudomonadota bacterium]